MEKWLYLAAAGAAGTTARYALGGWVQRVLGAGFPWGTLVVNVVGCGLFGVVWSLVDERNMLPAGTKLVVLTGFMGAFTTFSTIAFEASQMMREGQLGLAAANLAAHNVIGIAAMFGGFLLGRLF